MMTGAAEGAGRAARVWVALDSASRSEAALEVAATLARDVRAELAGLYVEDADLLRLAGLPLAAEMNPLSSALRPLGTADLERQWRGQAAGMERALARVARHAGLDWSFQVRRGKPLAEACALAALHEVTVIAGRRLAPAHRPAAPGRSPVVLLLDGAAAGPAARAFADGVALQLDARLEIIHDAGAAAAAARRAEVRLVLAARPAGVAPDTEMMRRLLAEIRCPLVLA
jgi:hypothetical protein